MSDILVSNKLQMIDDIIEDGQKLRSLNELIEKYDLSIPFTAYRAAGEYAGNFYEIVGCIEPGNCYPEPCINCGENIRWVGEGSVFISEGVLCDACDGECFESNWSPNYKLWTLG